MNDTTQKRVMTVDRLTLVIESQDRLIRAKDIQIGALAGTLREIAEMTVRDVLGDRFTRARQVAQIAVKEMANSNDG